MSPTLPCHRQCCWLNTCSLCGPKVAADNSGGFCVSSQQKDWLPVALATFHSPSSMTTLSILDAVTERGMASPWEQADTARGHRALARDHPCPQGGKGDCMLGDPPRGPPPRVDVAKCWVSRGQQPSPAWFRPGQKADVIQSMASSRHEDNPTQ